MKTIAVSSKYSLEQKYLYDGLKKTCIKMYNKLLRKKNLMISSRLNKFCNSTSWPSMKKLLKITMYIYLHCMKFMLLTRYTIYFAYIIYIYMKLYSCNIHVEFIWRFWLRSVKVAKLQNSVYSLWVRMREQIGTGDFAVSVCYSLSRAGNRWSPLYAVGESLTVRDPRDATLTNREELFRYG